MKYKSLEAKFYLFFFILFFISTIILSSSLVIFNSDISFYKILKIIIPIEIILVPVTILFGIKAIHYFRLKPRYVQVIKLDKVETYTTMACFVLKMKINNLDKDVKTLAIFSTSAISPLRVNKFSNKTALVGYDQKLNRAVILKITD